MAKLRGKKSKKKKNSLKLLSQNLKRSLKLFWIIDKKSLIGLIITILFLGIIPFISSYFWGQSLNYVVQYLGGNDLAKNQIIPYFVISLALGFLEGFLWRINEYFDRLSWFAWNEYMSVHVPAKIASLDISRFEDPKFNDLINKVEQGYGHRPTQFASNFLWTFYQFIQVISAIGILVAFAPILLPIIILSLVPSFWVQVQSSKLGWGIWNAKGDTNRKFYSNSWYLRNEDAVKEIRVYGIRDYLIDLISSLFKDFQKEQINLLKKTQRRVFLSDFIEEIARIGIEIWMLLRVLERTKDFGVGNFTFYRSTITNFTSGGRNLLRNFVKMYDDNLYMSDLFKLLDTENKITSATDAFHVGTKFPPKIEFKNVTFIYPKTDKKVFDNFSLTINPGEDIALVGENGAGKTTFIKLLLRFYDVTEGEIFVNGKNIKEIDLESYYQNIGVLFQNFNKYYYEVRENIAIGNIHNKEEQEIYESAKSAGAHEFVDKYKKKYKQFLAKGFKGGIEPSGGQWQRIALARAFYRNANILILDEPTSAIDAKGEYEIFQKISKVQEKKTTIIISHRFSTVRNADKIYVVDNGKITESGSHEELMTIKDGKYKHMFELQAEGYK